MRIKIRKKPTDGERRIIRKFLFLPVKINVEIRWLEFARIEQKYVEEIIINWMYRETYYNRKWVNIRFINYI